MLILRASELKEEGESLPTAPLLSICSMVEKGTDPFCWNGPQGAAHKRGLSPYSFAIRDGDRDEPAMGGQLPS